MTTGFIGLGAMGRPMAARLAAGGVKLAVMDRDTQRANAVASSIDALFVHDLAELAATCDTIITILPTSADVAEVIAGLRPALRPGALLIDMTSGAPATTQALAAGLADAGITLIDCPVSGGVPRARTGELAIMAGGPPAAIDRAEPLLRHMGTTILRTGPAGSAHAMKALNNLNSAGTFLLALETLVIGQRFGLDPAIMTDVLNASTGMSSSSQRKLKQHVLSRSFDAGFGLDLMVKDLGIALGVAHATGTPAPLAALVRELWTAAQAMLGPGQDHTAVAKLPEALAGITLGAPRT